MTHLLDLALGRRQGVVNTTPSQPNTEKAADKKQLFPDRLPLKARRALEQNKAQLKEVDGELFFVILVEVESRYWSTKLDELRVGKSLYYCPITNDCYPYIKEKAVNYVSLSLTDKRKRRWSVIKERYLSKQEISSISKYNTVKHPTLEIDHALLTKHY